MCPWEIVEKKGSEDIAVVYLLRSKSEDGVFIECVESLDPPIPPQDKWVITLSSQKGCPAKCSFCDASFYYRGNLSEPELLAQLNVIVDRHGGDGRLGSKKIKLHLARMGEPSFNDNIPGFLEEVKNRYPGAGFVPAIATIGPSGRDEWFGMLKRLKDEYFTGGAFQLQFSLNTTDERYRDKMMPARKMRFEEINILGDRWVVEGDRKVTLNFALHEGAPFDAGKIVSSFNPESFLVKLTPMNPTRAASASGMESDIRFDGSVSERVLREIGRLERAGFRVIVSIGSLEEIRTGSNCGQLAFARGADLMADGSGGVIMDRGGVYGEKSPDDSRI